MQAIAAAILAQQPLVVIGLIGGIGCQPPQLEAKYLGQIFCCGKGQDDLLAQHLRSRQADANRTGTGLVAQGIKGDLVSGRLTRGEVDAPDLAQLLPGQAPEDERALFHPDPQHTGRGTVFGAQSGWHQGRQFTAPPAQKAHQDCTATLSLPASGGCHARH